MKLKLTSLAVACFFIVSGVEAHRLNEYLYASTLSVEKDSVSLNLQLTPGSEIAGNILALIDRNADDIISEEEERAYSALILRGLSLLFDGKQIPFFISRRQFPATGEIRRGLGTIRLWLSAPVFPGPGAHHLIFSNEQHQRFAVYLVNCLMPAYQNIRIIDQSRNVNQSFYSLHFHAEKMLPSEILQQHQEIKREEHRAVFKTYFVDGTAHILHGYDHLLFLCALILGATGLWDLIKLVTAFTIAHSLTMLLATFGLVHLPANIVEPVISLSIVFAATKNLSAVKNNSAALKLSAAFFFGLFHGLGFAGGLLEIMHALPPEVILLAMLGFSLGVEAGNQLVLLPLYGLLRLFARLTPNAAAANRMQIFKKVASAAIACAGVYYLIIALANH